MSSHFPQIFTAAIAAALLLSGCAGEEGDNSTSGTPAATDPADLSPDDSPAEQMSATQTSAEDFNFEPISTAGSDSSSGSPGRAKSAGGAVAVEESIRAVMQRLKPLQVMLGQWRGTTRKEYDGFKAVDSHEWIWDLQGNKAQPALAITSDKSPYLRTGRLTWDAENSRFLLTAQDGNGVTREFTGDYTEPVREIVGDDDKLHRVFRLQFDQTEQSVEEAGGDAWQIAFAQQENNRYLLEMAKRRGTAAFRRYDTVSTQREGTSFALNDSDYGEKTCIISQGLGTSTVSYKGKTYWVCCSGCRAAFEEDPEAWIARAEKRAAEEN